MSSAPAGALGMAMQSITLLVQHRLISEVAHYQDSVDLRVVPSLCPLAVTPIDFAHTAELIERAHTDTNRWLDQDDHPQDQTKVLAFHAHPPC